MGVIEVEGVIKFVIHTAIVQDGFDGVTILQNSFFVHFVLGERNTFINMISVILSCHYGRKQRTDFICMLPKRLWGKFFSDFINNSWL